MTAKLRTTMAGKIRYALDQIIAERGRNNPTFVSITRTKLILKGLNPDKFNAASPDDPAILEKVRAVAGEMGVVLR